jgi:hypothetical protein
MRFFASLVGAAMLLVPALAFAANAPDLVKLKDGSMYRGTIAELVANDHVVIVLANGETRRFEMKDVTFAGPPPSEPAPLPAPPPPPPPPPPVAGAAAAALSNGGSRADLSLEANEEGVTYQLKVGQSDFAGVGFAGNRAVYLTGQASEYSTICVAPCKSSLPLGAHYIGLSQGDGRVVQPSEPVTISGPGKLDGTYTSNLGIRITGAVIALGSVGVGLAVMMSGYRSQEDCTADGICIKTNDNSVMGAGVGIMLAGGLVGTILLFIRDTAEITFTPAASSPVAKAREGVAFDGHGLVVRF